MRQRITLPVAAQRVTVEYTRDHKHVIVQTIPSTQRIIKAIKGATLELDSLEAEWLLKVGWKIQAPKPVVTPAPKPVIATSSRKESEAE